MIEARFAGVCQPFNPGGHAAFGIIVKADDLPIVERSGYVGFGPEMSTNVAEFEGFIAALEAIKGHEGGPRVIRGSSRLVVNTLLGKWKVKAGLYVPYFTKARAIYELERERVRLEIGDINSEVEKLALQELKNRGIRLRIVKAAGSGRRPGPQANLNPNSKFPNTPDAAIAAGYSMRHENVQCRGCPAMIDFWTTPNDKKIPVDHGTFVPHWTTCPNSQQFRSPK